MSEKLFLSCLRALSVVIVLSGSALYMGIYYGTEYGRKQPIFFGEQQNGLRRRSVLEQPTYNATKVAESLAARRQTLESVCRTMSGHQRLNRGVRYDHAVSIIGSDKTIEKGFFVDDTNRAIYCLIPKVASTALKQLLLYHAGVDANVTTMINDHDLVHNTSAWPSEISLKPLSFYADAKVRRRLFASYTKVVMVRHPLLRLVSAYNSKLSGSNDVYTKLHGNRIASRYGNGSSSVTLQHFFDYLCREVKPDAMSDVHWSSYNVQCLPCFVQYDYILKSENWNPEGDYVFGKSIFKKPNLEMIHSQAKTSSDRKWQQMLAQLPEKLVQDVRRIFAQDFELFGYNNF